MTAVGLTLQGPSEVPEGWTTIRFVNQSGMIHLAMFDVPPDGVDAMQMKRELVKPFQDYLDALIVWFDTPKDSAISFCDLLSARINLTCSMVSIL